MAGKHIPAQAGELTAEDMEEALCPQELQPGAPCGSGATTASRRGRPDRQGASTMIQIQIATSVTEQGVGDIRWVLLEAGEPVEPVGLEAGGGDPGGGAPVTVPARSHECDVPALPTVASGAEPSRTIRRWLGALALVASIGAAAWIASSLVDRGADDRSGRTSIAAQK